MTEKAESGTHEAAGDETVRFALSEATKSVYRYQSEPTSSLSAAQGDVAPVGPIPLNCLVDALQKL